RRSAHDSVGLPKRFAECFSMADGGRPRRLQFKAPFRTTERRGTPLRGHLNGIGSAARKLRAVKFARRARRHPGAPCAVFFDRKACGSSAGGDLPMIAKSPSSKLRGMRLLASTTRAAPLALAFLSAPIISGGGAPLSVGVAQAQQASGGFSVV